MNAVENQAVDAASSNPYVVSYLKLCQLSYQNSNTISQAVHALQPVNPGGSWQCVWGPAQPLDQSNLAFVAAYFDQPGTLAFAAVVLRGTDVAIDNVWGIIEQMAEDFDVLHQTSFPWMPAGSGALVAQGSLDALNIVQQLTYGGQRLLPFLTAMLSGPQAKNASLVVAGHSLGGCLATLVAPWLQVTLGQSAIGSAIVPVTFAAPTAGNSGFSDYYSSNLSRSMRYFNSLDIAPLAWQSLESMKTIYSPDGVSAPELVQFGIDFYEALMDKAGVSYSQPTANAIELPGQFSRTAPTWLEQAYFQHHTTTYMTLLGGTSVAAEWPRQRRVRYAY
jgi:Lipase (class 3)